MSEYGMPHESQSEIQQPNQLLTMYKAFVGTVLVAIGLILGLYVAITVFKIINGSVPPGIITQFAEPAADQLIENAQENLRQAFDLSPDVKRVILYSLTFLFLVLPVAIATSLISAGAKLMHSDAAEALKIIAEKLKKTP